MCYIGTCYKPTKDQLIALFGGEEFYEKYNKIDHCDILPQYRSDPSQGDPYVGRPSPLILNKLANRWNVHHNFNTLAIVQDVSTKSYASRSQIDVAHVDRNLLFICSKNINSDESTKEDIANKYLIICPYIRSCPKTPMCHAYSPKNSEKLQMSFIYHFSPTYVLVRNNIIEGLPTGRSELATALADIVKESCDSGFELKRMTRDANEIMNAFRGGAASDTHQSKTHHHQQQQHQQHSMQPTSTQDSTRKVYGLCSVASELQRVLDKYNMLRSSCHLTAETQKLHNEVGIKNALSSLYKVGIQLTSVLHEIPIVGSGMKMSMKIWKLVLVSFQEISRHLNVLVDGDNLIEPALEHYLSMRLSITLSKIKAVALKGCLLSEEEYSSKLSHLFDEMIKQDIKAAGKHQDAVSKSDRPSPTLANIAKKLKVVTEMKEVLFDPFYDKAKEAQVDAHLEALEHNHEV